MRSVSVSVVVADVHTRTVLLTVTVLNLCVSRGGCGLEVEVEGPSRPHVRVSKILNPKLVPMAMPAVCE